MPDHARRRPAPHLNRLARWGVLVSLCLSLFAGCDEDAATQEQLKIQVYHERGLGLPPLAVDSVEVVISEPESGAVIASERFDVDAGAEGVANVLDELPFDTTLRLQLSALNSNGDVVATGGTRPVDVARGSGVTPWVIYMLATQRFASMRAPFGSADGAEIKVSLFEEGGRTGHTATRLDDGRVLLAGGAVIDRDAGLSGTDIASIHDTLLIFDPQVGYFDIARDGAGAPLRLSAARAYHTATLLNDGRVLIVGGLSTNGGALTTLRSVDIIEADSSSGRFNVLPFAPLSAPRVNHTATARSDGTVLVTGGRAINDTSVSVLASAELFDPNTLRFLPSQPMDEPRHGHAATLLVDGRSVLITGGFDGATALSSIEVFHTDGNGLLEFTPGPPLSVGRWGHAVERFTLAENLLIIVGGEVDDGMGGTTPTDLIEVLDILSGRTIAQGSLIEPRAHLEMMTLYEDTGDLVAFGGVTSKLNGIPIARRDGERIVVTQSEITAFPIEGGMQLERYETSNVRLHNGMVLITGGRNDTRSIDSAEMFNP